LKGMDGTKEERQGRGEKVTGHPKNKMNHHGKGTEKGGDCRRALTRILTADGVRNFNEIPVVGETQTVKKQK